MSSGRGDGSRVRTDPPVTRGITAGVPFVFGISLLLLATGRWGSYLHVPGVPLFIGDAGVLLALGQAGVLWRKGLISIQGYARTPRMLRLLMAILAWAIVRFVWRSGLSLVALRDFAPYGYVLVGLVTYVAPVRSATHSRVAIYVAFMTHAAWFSAATHGLINTSKTPMLNPPEVSIFSIRGDFDAAVFGIAIAFALHQILMGPRPRTRLHLTGVIGFMGINAFAVVSQPSRAGLLSTIAAIATVIVAWMLPHLRGTVERNRARVWSIRACVTSVMLLVVGFVLQFTVPGRRLVEGFTGADGDSAGTLHARLVVYRGVGSYLLSSPLRALFGVGFGPDFLAASHTLSALEGNTYKDVRSPHNYLLGTWARLGVIGAILALLLILAAARYGFGRISQRTHPADVLAGLIVVTIPVAAMLGVILESPFGAIPYFWAVGQLCATMRRRRRGSVTAEGAVAPASASAQS